MASRYLSGLLQGGELLNHGSGRVAGSNLSPGKEMLSVLFCLADIVAARSALALLDQFHAQARGPCEQAECMHEEAANLLINQI